MSGRRLALWSLPLALAIGAALPAGEAGRWWAVDRCLDSGGAWSYQFGKCQH